MQRDALLAAGVPAENITTEHVSGTKAARPGLDRLLSRLGEGDVLVVWRLDRLGRSTHHLITLAEDFRARGVELRSVTEGIDTTTAAGRLMFSIMSSLAEFEAALIRERTAAGLAAARASGKQVGRPSRVTPEQVRMIHRLANEEMSHRQIAASVGLPRSTVGRVLRGEVASLEGFVAQADDQLL